LPLLCTAVFNPYLMLYMRVRSTRQAAARLVFAGLLVAAASPAAAGAQTPAAAQPSTTAAQPATPPVAVIPDRTPTTAAQPATPPTAVVPDRTPTTTAPAPAAGTAGRPELDEPHAVEDPGLTKTTPQEPSKPKPAAGADATPKQPPAGAAAPAPTSAGPSGAALAAIPGAAQPGVPSYFIDSFRIPVFLLPIFQAAGTEYGVRWEILAAINEIETDYGRNLRVSSAGATGWMQFMPASWAMYGVDANRDGRADPYNPMDAIFAAARYLQAAGAQSDLRRAIFAYNHAGWYVSSVLDRAQRLAALPSDLVGALTGLARGRPPVLGPARALPSTSPRSRTLKLSVKNRPRVVAVADGRVVRIGRSARLGRFVQLRDVFGNTYTYGMLARVARRFPALRASRPTDPATKPGAARAAGPLATADAGHAAPRVIAERTLDDRAAAERRARPAVLLAGPIPVLDWPAQARRMGIGQAAQAPARRRAVAHRPTAYDRRLLGGVAASSVAYRPLREGARVVAGTILGRAGTRGARPLRFEIRPAGVRSARIDPAPIVAGWKLLEASSSGAATTTGETSIGQVMLLGKHALERLVLANPRIAIYPCGLQDIRAGRIDRRVLAMLQMLAMSGLSPTVSALQCGHGRLTASGRVSEHASGNAVDIAAINGTPILGNQGAGSIADTTIRRLLTLQGAMAPHQIISLMTYAGATNTLALADHADHIHVGFSPQRAPGSLEARLFDGQLEPSAWQRLIDRLAAIKNPRVRTEPSAAAVLAPPRKP